LCGISAVERIRICKVLRWNVAKAGVFVRGNLLPLSIIRPA
jgi:hypothetical protein